MPRILLIGINAAELRGFFDFLLDIQFDLHMHQKSALKRVFLFLDRMA
jgi:hypothetical protein